MVKFCVGTHTEPTSGRAGYKWIKKKKAKRRGGKMCSSVSYGRVMHLDTPKLKINWKFTNLGWLRDATE